MMKVRRCIFCGKPFTGQKRNFEHVLPAWLVREADLKKRTAEVSLGSKKFNAAMSRIGGQSCETCNTESAKLEGAAQSAYVKIRDGNELMPSDGLALLDWLDKVRTGLWLWALSAGKTEYNFEPKFYINQRGAAKDRLALIAKYFPIPTMKGLAIWGASECFIWSPSIIGFVANNIAIVSISSELIVTRHLRKISFTRTIDDTNFEGAEVEETTATGPQLQFLGNPTIIGQYILPVEVAVDLKLDVQEQSASHPGFIDGPVLRLDGQLRSLGPQLGRAASVPGRSDAHLALMEMNLERSWKFLLEDFLRSDFSRLSDEKDRRGIPALARRFLAEAEVDIGKLKRIYEIRSGIRLPF